MAGEGGAMLVQPPPACIIDRVRDRYTTQQFVHIGLGWEIWFFRIRVKL